MTSLPRLGIPYQGWHLPRSRSQPLKKIAIGSGVSFFTSNQNRRRAMLRHWAFCSFVRFGIIGVVYLLVQSGVNVFAEFTLRCHCVNYSSIGLHNLYSSRTALKQATVWPYCQHLSRRAVQWLKGCPPGDITWDVERGYGRCKRQTGMLLDLKSMLTFIWRQFFSS